jgi:membrane associated rhomboid family serine protease
MACVMVVAWVTGFLCDKGMPHMIASGIVYIVAGALCLLLTE